MMGMFKAKNKGGGGVGRSHLVESSVSELNPCHARYKKWSLMNRVEICYF